MIYVQKKCPYCKNIIQPFQSDSESAYLYIGIPFEKCPYCSFLFLKNNTKEINMMTNYDWVNYWGNRILRALGYGIIISIIPMVVILNIIEHSKTASTICIIVCCVIFLMTIFMFLKAEIADLKIAKTESLNRLKDEKYLNVIKQLIKK